MGSPIAVADNVNWSVMKKVVVGNDLSDLSDQEIVTYYRSLCESLGLNPLTRPFQLIRLNGKLTLYAVKDATDQLRRRYQVSIDRIERTIQDEMCIVTAYGHDASGRSDSEIGAVPLQGLRGENRANAIMKCMTKAKRRLTLSLCGLGFLDETEVATIAGAQHVPLPEAVVNDGSEANPTADVKVHSRTGMADFGDNPPRAYNPYGYNEGPDPTVVDAVTGEVISLATRAQLQKFWILARELYNEAAEQAVREWLSQAHPQTIAVSAETGRKEYSTKLLTVEQISQRIEFMQRNITARDSGIGTTDPVTDTQDTLFPEGGPNLPEPLPPSEMEQRQQHDQPQVRPTRPQRKVTSADFQPGGADPIPFK